MFINVISVISHSKESKTRRSMSTINILRIQLSVQNVKKVLILNFFLKNHMNKKHNKIKNKSVHNDNYVTIKNNESELKISKDNDHEDYAEDSDNDSDSDTLEPHICPECGKECDDLENFSDHFKQVHNS